jgi:hypothetical protein
LKTSSKFALAAIIALALASCSEGASSYESGRRDTSDVKWLQQGKSLSACRDDQTDLGYGFGDRLYLKIPLRVEQNERLDCSRLLKPPDMILGPVPIIPIQEPIYEILVDPQVIRLAQAAQWMNSSQGVYECIQRFKTFGQVHRWAGALNRARELHPAESEVVFRVLNCGEDHLFFVIPSKVPSGTVACGKADVLPCGAAPH